MTGSVEVATQERRQEWLAAMRWRRRVEAVLREAGLTFTQWLVLVAARELIRETGDAVSQRQIADRVELDEATLSQVMRTLDKKGLVSRGPDMFCKAWRVFIDREAERVLDDYRGHLEAASSHSPCTATSRTAPTR